MSDISDKETIERAAQYHRIQNRIDVLRAEIKGKPDSLKKQKVQAEIKTLLDQISQYGKGTAGMDLSKKDYTNAAGRKSTPLTQTTNESFFHSAFANDHDCASHAHKNMSPFGPSFIMHSACPQSKAAAERAQLKDQLMLLKEAYAKRALGDEKTQLSLSEKFKLVRAKLIDKIKSDMQQHIDDYEKLQKQLVAVTNMTI